ncbi:MAG TPA: TolC family protein [Candidatus Eisenbacteria bacterium]|nr:TolC family protein [Candidatus Eisenbacteria bacterium]
MPVFRFVNVAVRKSLALILAATLAGVSFAQEPAPTTPPAPIPLGDAVKPLPQAPKPQGNAYKLYSDQNYSKGQSQWPKFWSVWGVRNMPRVNFTNSPLIDQVVRDGKIYLSLDEAVALALENNLDIAIQRYNLITADVDILRTSSGSPALGVNTGLVQGTPGGAGSTATSSTVGGGAGGGSIGVGGAGAGAAGIVASTQGEGAPIDNFDPVLTGTGEEQHAISPTTNVFAGATALNQATTTANILYTQGFPTGTLMSVGYNNSRISTNSFFNTVNPVLTSNFQFQLRQHLLQGFGFNSNLRWIRIARNDRAIMDAAYQNQIMTTVSQIENIYWDLVNAYENVKVQQRALELAEKTLSDTEKQVEIGTLAPIMVVQSQSSVATAKQNLIVSQTNLQLQQLLMKNAITRNNTDSILANAPVVPTDTLQINEPFQVPPVEQLIDTALKNRPEIIQSRLNLTNRQVGLRAIKNLQLPTVDVFAFYGGTGLAGDQNPYITCGNPAAPPSQCLPAGSIPDTGYWHAFGNMFNSSAPDKGVGVNINIPLRNRQNQADQVRSVIEYRQAELSAQQQANTITLQVRNAQFALQQNYAALQAAIAARDYAKQNLDAEQKKYSLGASTSTLVLQASSALTQAESNVLAAATNYEKSRVQLDLFTADTLTKLGINLADAESGKVTKMPKVPGIVPGTPTGTSAPAPSQPPPSANPPKQ